MSTPRADPKQPISIPSNQGIPPNVRRSVQRMVLELRSALEDDFHKQLNALGLRESGRQALPAGRQIALADERAGEVAAAVIQREAANGTTWAEALEAYVRESAFTFLNRAIGLRCLEERGLLLVDGQTETVLKIDPARNASSLYWRVRNELSPSTSPREVWREALHRACASVSQQVRVLFDPESEHAALLPLQPTLQRVVDALNAPEVPPETYAQDELLGWVYQYYNSQEKKAVYDRLKKGRKIERPEELAAATCLYTERYMVDYLLQNTLGALWVEMHPQSKLPEQWPYYVRPPAESPRPQRPPRPLREITLLDPCCGSGHFLLRAFDTLVDMYREEGREAEEEIPHLILERNLYGIDIDLRAVQIAALRLYLRGCATAGAGFRPRRLNLVAADVILPGDAPPREHMARFQGDRDLKELATNIWRELKGARMLGSLLHPERAVDELIKRQREEDQRRYPMLQRGDAEWAQWKEGLLKGLREEFECQAQSTDLGQRLFGQEVAKGVGLVEALGQQYDVVLTNPPYAGSGNLDSRLKRFIEHEYKNGKRDLYAAFIRRCREFCQPGGYVGMVSQQSWMFLRSFADLRQDVLKHATIDSIAHLGEHAFDDPAAAGAFVALFTLRTSAPAPEHRLVGLRLIGPKSPGEKEALLRRALTPDPSPAVRERGAEGGVRAGLVSTPRQADFLPIPETPLVYWLRPRFFELLQSAPRLGDIAEVRQGLATADDERFTRFVWEVPCGEWSRPVRERRWVPFEKGGGYGKWFGHQFWVVDWEDNGARIKSFPASVVRNEQYYFREGWTYSYMARGSLGVRLLDNTTIFSHLGSAILFHGNAAGAAALVNCRFASWVARSISAKIQLNESYVSRVPLPERAPAWLPAVVSDCLSLKRRLVALDPLERTFASLGVEPSPPAPLPLAGEGRPSSTSAGRHLADLPPAREGYWSPTSARCYLAGLPRSGEGRRLGFGVRVLRGDSSTAVKELARALRRAGNRPEDALWEALRDRRFLGLKFRRQHPLGPFIADFYCVEHRLVVEIDGAAHGAPEAQARDQARDLWMEEHSIMVVRIPASVVLDSPERALQAIVSALSRRPSTEPAIPRVPVSPLPLGGRGAGGEGPSTSLLAQWLRVEFQTQAIQAVLHSLEALSERLVCDAYELDADDIQAITDETGIPAGWYPLLNGYDTLPDVEPGANVPEELVSHLGTHERKELSPEALARLKSRLRILYQGGPGTSVEEAGDRSDGDEEGEPVLGGHIPIPPETFLEELSQKLEIHPISVYWLLEEMREQEGLVCPPELKRHMEDYVSVSILRMLGFRWPEQDAYEKEHGPIMDPSLVVDDGVIPLVECGDQATAEQRVRMRLERDFGEEGAAQSEREFRQWVGKDIGEWLRRDFFRRHVQQFKQRPIAWHLVSPERTFEAFVLYHKLSRALLQRLRTEYAGKLIARLRVEQARARERQEAARARGLQLQIEDVEEFRRRLEAIERGDELKYRIRCRWKGEEETGRPGPYAPDIDDGVKVNIRPFQEAGLLAVKEVIKKW